MKILGLASLCLVPLAVSAAPVTYECKYTSHSRTGWVPVDAYYAVDEATNTVVAYDGYIQLVQKKPLKTEMSMNAKKKMAFRYTLKGVPARGNSKYTVSYSVRLDPARGQSNLRANVHGFDNEVRATGKCTRSK